MAKKRTISDDSVKALAGAVLVQAAKDIDAQRNADYKSAERDVRDGGADLYLDIIGLDISGEEFIRRARRGK